MATEWVEGHGYPSGPTNQQLTAESYCTTIALAIPIAQSFTRPAVIPPPLPPSSLSLNLSLPHPPSQSQFHSPRILIVPRSIKPYCTLHIHSLIYIRDSVMPPVKHSASKENKLHLPQSCYLSPQYRSHGNGCNTMGVTGWNSCWDDFIGELGEGRERAG